MPRRPLPRTDKKDKEMPSLNRAKVYVHFCWIVSTYGDIYIYIFYIEFYIHRNSLLGLCKLQILDEETICDTVIEGSSEVYPCCVRITRLRIRQRFICLCVCNA